MGKPGVLGLGRPVGGCLKRPKTGDPQSHEILKVLLPRLSDMISDTALSVRAAAVDLLLAVRDLRSFQYNKVRYLLKTML